MSICRRIKRAKCGLDGTQPGLPLKKEPAGTITHDYTRETLFGALNMLDSTVLGGNMQRHRHQEFIRFLNAMEAQVLAEEVVHVILDDLRRPQSAPVALAPRDFHLPLHSNVLLLAQRRRRLLRQAH